MRYNEAKRAYARASCKKWSSPWPLICDRIEGDAKKPNVIKKQITKYSVSDVCSSGHVLVTLSRTATLVMATHLHRSHNTSATTAPLVLITSPSWTESPRARSLRVPPLMNSRRRRAKVSVSRTARFQQRSFPDAPHTSSGGGKRTRSRTSKAKSTQTDSSRASPNNQSGRADGLRVASQMNGRCPRRAKVSLVTKRSDTLQAGRLSQSATQPHSALQRSRRMTRVSPPSEAKHQPCASHNLSSFDDQSGTCTAATKSMVKTNTKKASTTRLVSTKLPRGGWRAHISPKLSAKVLRDRNHCHKRRTVATRLRLPEDILPGTPRRRRRGTRTSVVGDIGVYLRIVNERERREKKRCRRLRGACLPTREDDDFDEDLGGENEKEHNRANDDSSTGTFTEGRPSESRRYTE